MSQAAALSAACQLAVIGAGPAGLAAAATAAKLGVDTILLDEQSAPGGQIYRAITETPASAESSPTSSRYAWPPPKSRGNFSFKPALTRSKVS